MGLQIVFGFVFIINCLQIWIVKHLSVYFKLGTRSFIQELFTWTFQRNFCPVLKVLTNLSFVVLQLTRVKVPLFDQFLLGSFQFAPRSIPLVLLVKDFDLLPHSEASLPLDHQLHVLLLQLAQLLLNHYLMVALLYHLLDHLLAPVKLTHDLLTLPVYLIILICFARALVLVEGPALLFLVHEVLVSFLV